MINFSGRSRLRFIFNDNVLDDSVNFISDNFLEFIEPNGPNIPGWSNPNILTPDLIKNINHLMPLYKKMGNHCDSPTFGNLVNVIRFIMRNCQS